MVKKKLGVVALEIGFPVNGNGFSFKDEPWTVKTCWMYHADDIIRVRYSVPMCILFTKDRLFHSLGHEAEEKYLGLEEDDEHRDWFFYKDLDLGQVRTTMTDANGKTMSSKTVIASWIRYQHDQLLKLMLKTGTPIGDMAFVIVIPGNMAYGTKCFIFEAALEAGIERKDLSLVSRPMANLAYCQHLLAEGSKIKQTKHMIIIDLQESSAEVHVFEKKADESFTCLMQYIRSTREVSCRQQMQQWLKDTLGHHVYDRICREEKRDIIDFDRSVEIRFMNLKPSLNEVLHFRIPDEFSNIYTDMTGKEMETIEGADFKISRFSKVIFRKTFIEKVLRPYIEIVNSMIGQVEQDGDVRGPSTQVYFVGTLSKCQYVTEATIHVLRNHISGVSTTVVTNPDGAAVQGGVLSGYKTPPSSPPRVARYVCDSNPFADTCIMYTDKTIKY